MIELGGQGERVGRVVLCSGLHTPFEAGLFCLHVELCEAFLVQAHAP